MLKLPKRHDIKLIYTNHKYRSFSAPFNRKAKAKNSANQFLKLRQPIVSATKPLTQRTEKRKQSKCQIRRRGNSQNGRQLQKFVYFTPSKSSSQIRPQSSIKKYHSARELQKQSKVKVNGSKYDMLITPCNRNFQYQVNEFDKERISSKIMASDFLLQPCKISAIPFSQRPNMNTPLEIQRSETENKFTKCLPCINIPSIHTQSAKYFERRSHMKYRPKEPLYKKGQIKKRDDLIEPWDYVEDYDFSKQQSRQL